MLANMCVFELYKIISQCFDMFGFKKKNLNFEHFSSLMMIPWYCGFCLNEHQCFDEKDEQYHFKLCSRGGSSPGSARLGSLLKKALARA